MKRISWQSFLKPWARKSGKNSEQLSEEAKTYILDDIDLTTNAFAFKFTPTDFKEELKKFAPSTSEGADPEQDEEWREIPGFPNYIINREGVVRGRQSLVDVPLRVRLWQDDNHAEHHTIKYLRDLAFPEPFKLKTDFADAFVDRLLMLNRTEMHTQALADSFNNDYGVVISSEPPKITPLICKHCNRKIEYKSGGYIHAEGIYRGKARCDPHDSQLVYGYNADPVGAECSAICLGAKE